MRSKEEANDYRYFPCPDLLPVVLDNDYISALRAALPELPDAKQARFVQQYGLSDYDASQLSAERVTADFYEQTAAASGDAKLAANWVMVELLAALNKNGLDLVQSPVSAAQLGGMIARIKDGTISGKIAKQVFELLWNEGGNADAIIEKHGLKQVSDSGAIEKIVDDIIANNPQQVENYRSATEDKRPKMLGFFVGQIMKASQGKANPQQVNEILLKKLQS
jgi:aspartyl-tRNA(Asn)/glutamyl-tRNA(Gln) amidotransferase subunit B